MFRNYLTVALRNILRHRLYSAINIAGLAVGLACAILIMLFVRDEAGVSHSPAERVRGGDVAAAAAALAELVAGHVV